jgi:tetratricopeptide (TPR) repeat protein
MISSLSELLDKAKKACRNGDFDKALELYLKADKLEPKDGYIYEQITKSLHYLGRNHEAVKYGIIAMQLSPTASWACNWTGMAYEKVREYEKAIECYNKSISISEKANDPQEAANGYKYKAQTLAMLKKFKEALECNAIAIKKVPYITYYLDRAGIYLDMGNKEEALETYDDIIKMWPNDFYGYMRKGELLQKNRRYSEALACFAKALGLIKKGIKGMVAFPNQLSFYSERFESLVSKLTELTNNQRTLEVSIQTNGIADGKLVSKYNILSSSLQSVLGNMLNKGMQNELESKVIELQNQQMEIIEEMRLSMEKIATLETKAHHFEQFIQKNEVFETQKSEVDQKSPYENKRSWIPSCNIF